MDFTLLLITIASIYCVLMFFDMFFKSCAHYPYISFLNGTGLKIKFFQFTWNTTAFNRILLRWGNSLQYLKSWFTAGLYVTLFLLPISLALLFISMIQSTFFNKAGSQVTPTIEPLIPGINLPSDEIGYYCASIVISSVIHELGHALASVQEDVHIINVGLNVLFLLPVAYVNLNADKLYSLNPWKQLKIMCAGIWHNITLSTVAYVLYISLPFMYSLIFKTNQGVYISSITESSPLLGGRGLDINDIIYKVNYCDVKNKDTFLECLQKINNDRYGYCLNKDLINNLDDSVPLRHTNQGVDCCDSKKLDGLCFEYLDNSDGVLEIPPYVCLSGRIVVESSQQYCKHDNVCADKLFCIKPILLDNNTALMKIKRYKKPDVIYMGHPADLIQTMEVSSFIPKFIFSNFFIPNVVLRFLEYIIVISTGLALINIVPCIYMDGQHIMSCLIQILVPQYSTEKARIITTIVTLVTTFFLLAYFIYNMFLKLY